MAHSLNLNLLVSLDTSTSTSVPCYDEAGSDRGYHSDQSPEANKQPRLVKPKPKKVKKTKVKRECFSINTEGKDHCLFSTQHSCNNSPR